MNEQIQYTEQKITDNLETLQANLDGSFEITRNGYPYHVPNNDEFHDDWVLLKQWAVENADKVTVEEYVSRTRTITPVLPLSEQAQLITLSKMDFFELVVGLTANTQGMTPITYDMLEQFINTYVGEGSAEIRMGWQYANDIPRNHHLLEQVTAIFGIPNELLDIMYVNAKQLLHKLRNGLPL